MLWVQLRVAELFVRRWFIFKGLGLTGFRGGVIPFSVTDHGMAIETVSRVL